MTTYRTRGSLSSSDLAVMSLAGLRYLAQSSASPTTGAAATYTVTEDNTRRVIFMHLGASSPAAGDIRFKVGATAASTDMPLLNQRYVVIDMVKGETVSFWNTSADTIKVYAMEIE